MLVGWIKKSLKSPCFGHRLSILVMWIVFTGSIVHTLQEEFKFHYFANCKFA